MHMIVNANVIDANIILFCFIHLSSECRDAFLWNYLLLRVCFLLLFLPVMTSGQWFNHYCKIPPGLLWLCVCHAAPPTAVGGTHNSPGISIAIDNVAIMILNIQCRGRGRGLVSPHQVTTYVYKGEDIRPAAGIFSLPDSRP